ncbi:naphthoyl-CoA synthase [Seminavis robusta]|uniref:Naphthoyl-CoA synthase n=1 Tax=Seminavis robusta TaxID=568900 RepID=A0A9N8HGW1_9STRA|nr:naphthoyl-CoA synthase [Seminavis robusta]|eukprot:Sro529_g161070.1 naphthoyl-CoA synthase (317) ;mRNA; f:46945-47895
MAPSKSTDVASMSAARSASKTAPPTTARDGFDLISRTPIVWDTAAGTTFQDITYQISSQDMCARIAFNRPQVLHAFRPQTIREIQQALEMAVDDVAVGVILLASNCDETQYTPAFCAGGDQTVRANDGGYQDGTEAFPKLRVLDLQVQMRRCPKPIIAVVEGYAIGGGHILHMIADLTLAADNAIFGQTGPRMGSIDAGYGSTHMARLVGQKRAREIWFLCRFYNAQEAYEMGLINAQYPKQELEGRVAQWVRRIIMNSPTAIACAKAALNADEDGAAGIAQMGGEITRLFYMSKESQEGRNSFLERRAPQFRSKL